MFIYVHKSYILVCIFRQKYYCRDVAYNVPTTVLYLKIKKVSLRKPLLFLIVLLKLLFFSHNLAVEQIHNSVSITCIPVGVSYHDDCRTFFI